MIHVNKLSYSVANDDSNHLALKYKRNFPDQIQETQKGFTSILCIVEGKIDLNTLV